MKGDEDSAYPYMLMARSELNKEKDQDILNELRQKYEGMIDQVAGAIIGPGTYVNNTSLLQSWIGKVLSRDGSTLKIRITYARQDSGLNKGEVIERNYDQVKELKSISVDAALNGWQ